MFNPFPGLRPFEPEEDHLFFGREQHVDELLRRLRLHRFLAIVGSSGSGKSSLVRSGLIPALYGGFMVQTSPNWRIGIMRPGEDPIHNLAALLNKSEMLGTTGELQTTNCVLLEATLRRGTRGLVEATRQARISSDDNLLIVVDQFEELFRFRRNPQIENSRDEAVAFVKLLLEAAQQQEFPIFVAITMRSDFIGDCMDYPRLPEAVNGGQYLVPRMTRDELRSSITGPVAVGGATIAQRLVLRLLNDFGDEHDKLPVLQHALMRTWDRWASKGRPAEPIDLDDYESIGTMEHALSLHADEAYEETGSEVKKLLTEKIFKALTDTFSDPRGTRRPTSVEELMQTCGAAEHQVVDILEVFRRPGRSFLMPPSQVQLEKHTIVDLSHESLMRCWTRLSTWTEEERVSAEIYARLSDATTWHESGKAGLWRNPELEVGEKWRREESPTQAWSRRYNDLFPQVMTFLDLSGRAREEEVAERRRERLKKLRQTQWAAGVFGLLFIAALFLAIYAWTQNRLAQNNLSLAKQAVDQSLSSAGREQAREQGDLPQTEQFRKELLDRAAVFYSLFAKQNSTNTALLTEEARAHSRLGDISRLLGDFPAAVREYNESIARFADLSKRHPSDPELIQQLAYCHNWLGETFRQSSGVDSGDTVRVLGQAESEYGEAIRLQQELSKDNPANDVYRQELARTFYNRGIVRFQTNREEDAVADFSRAQQLLEPMVAHGTLSSNPELPSPAQELARVYNNSAIVAGHREQRETAKSYYERAIRLSEQLLRSNPENREYKVELAQYADNEARAFVDEDRKLASERNQRALELLDELNAGSPAITLKRAQSLQLRSQLVEDENPREATALTDNVFLALLRLEREGQSEGSLAALYMNVSINYLEIAQGYLKRGRKREAQTTMVDLTKAIAHVGESDRSRLTQPYQELQAELSRSRAR